MQKLFRCVAVLAALVATTAAYAQGPELQLSMANGRVTLIANEVPIRQILAEWARIGQTRIVNGDKLTGPPVTLQLTDVPEGQALDAILRSASGYVVAPRAAGLPGPSMYDRIMILATSRAPAMTASAPPPAFTRPQPQAQPFPAQVENDDQEPDDVVTPPGVVPGTQQYPGVVNTPVPGTTPVPGQQPQQTAPMLTAPRPGMVPQQSPVPGNPYQPNPQQPIVRPPGTRPGGGPGGPGGGN